MPIKKILVPVRGDGKGEGVLDHALALAKRSNAHIDVIHARAPASEFLSQSVMVTQSMRRSVRELAEREADDHERRVRKLFTDYCETHNLEVAESAAEAAGRVTVDWRERRGSQASVVGLWGRLADLIAVAQPSKDRTLGHNTLEAALFQAGKLVLVCPPKPVGATICEHMAVAWDGSTESARVVSAALPLLQHAKAVSILQVSDGSPELSAQALVEYLAWWGVPADVHEFPHKHTIGRDLYTNAKAIGGDVMLMGAYGHSRSREIILGGATREVIENTDIPVLMQK